jgi:hypothetical protein
MPRAGHAGAAVSEIICRRRGAMMVKKTNRKKKRGLKVLATQDLKIEDLIIGERLRAPRDEDVAKLAESLKTIGQARAITVREDPDTDAKYRVITGVTLVKAAETLNRLNDQGMLLPIADGLVAAHQKCIFKGYLASKVGCILKAPRKAYRLYKWQQETSAGKVLLRFRQKKDDLRPGERLTLFRLLQDLHLDQLALAGGEGADLLRRVKRRALRDLSN